MFDYVVIGGGVVGVAVFNKLVLSGLKCALIEKEQDLATGCSKANTGLIHAGFDAMPGTLKARLNVQGAKMFPRVCSRLGIKYKKTGAIVVGDNLEKINELYQRGKTNGVKKLKILNKKQTQKQEFKFGEFFSKKEKKTEPKKIDGEDITTTVTITKKEALCGTIRKVNILETEKCPK